MGVYYMEKLRIAICDDDRSEYEQLVKALDRCGFSYEADYFESGEELLESYYAGRYDLFILDIYMDGISGVDLASKIRSAERDVPMAFLTTSPNHAMDGYRFHVDRYILKPYDEKDIEELVRLADERKDRLPSVTVHANRRDHVIPYARIRYMESSKHSVSIYLTGGDILQTGMKLAELVAMLPSPPFYQCHKSYVVNFDHVRFFNKELNMFEMSESGNAYISRAKVREAEKTYKGFMFDLTRKQDYE